MSYTPDEQLLSKPILALSSAIDGFCQAALARAKAPTEWSPEHIDELMKLVNELRDMQVRLLRLETEVR